MSSQLYQLSLLTPQFDDRIRRTEINGVVHFSILDVFQYYGKKANPTQSWKATLKTLEKQGFETTQIVEWRPDGQQGGRTTPVAPFKMFLRIAQVAEIAEWEGIRGWMAEVAHERIEEYSNPELGEQRARRRSIEAYQRMGKDDTFIQKRLKSLDKRNDFTAVAKETHRFNKPDYVALTNITYKGIFGMIKAEMVKVLNLNAKQVARFRDHLNVLAVDAISTAEGAASIKMARSGVKSLSTDEQIEIAMECARRIAPSFWNVAEYIGIDLVTGTPILEE